MSMRRISNKKGGGEVKAVFINASKERNGQTHRLGEHLLRGVELQTIHLIDYKIAPLGQVYAKDEYHKVIDQLFGSDVIVFGTPVYWSDMTGYLKIFIDRLQDLMDTDLASTSNPFYRAQSYLLIQGTAPDDAIPGVNRVIEHISDRFLMDYKGYVTSVEEANHWNKIIIKRKDK